MPVYMLISTVDQKIRDHDVPLGSCLGKIVWDGEAKFDLPPDTVLEPDNGRRLWFETIDEEDEK